MVYNAGEYGEHIGDYGETMGPLGRIDYHKLLEEKLAKARDKMDEYEFGAFLCLSDSNVEYITNLPAFHGGRGGGGQYAILPENGDPIAFAEASRAYQLNIEMPDYMRAENAIPLPSSKPYNSLPDAARRDLIEQIAEQIGGHLEDHGLANETVGVDWDSPILIQGLKDYGLDVSLEGKQALDEARVIKTETEQDLFRRLNAVLDGTFAKLAETARPGVTEREVWAECNKYMINRGLSVNGGFIASGPHTWPKDSNREASDRILRPGDTVFADFFRCDYFGYNSCYYRTFTIGPASEEQKETYDRMNQWTTEAEAKMEPGVTTEEVVSSWPDEIELWHDRPPYIQDEKDSISTFFMNMGHGIGLDQYEAPFFWKPTARKYPQELKEGMVIAIETMDGSSDGSQGARIEDMVLITSNGCEVLSRWPKDSVTELPLY